MDPTAIAIAGILGTLLGAVGGPLILAERQARHERAARNNDMLIALYIKAIAHTETREGWINWLCNEYRTGDGPHLPEVEHQALVTAQMRLLAPKPVLDAWLHMQLAKEHLLHVMRTEYETNQDDGRPHVEIDFPDVEQAMKTIATFRQVVRQAMGVTD